MYSDWSLNYLVATSFDMFFHLALKCFELQPWSGPFLVQFSLVCGLCVVLQLDFKTLSMPKKDWSRPVLHRSLTPAPIYQDWDHTWQDLGQDQDCSPVLDRSGPGPVLGLSSVLGPVSRTKSVWYCGHGES